MQQHLINEHSDKVRPASKASPPRRKPAVAEARPWESYNSDGSPNLGSYEVQGAQGMVLLAHDLLLAYKRRLTSELGQEMVNPLRGEVRALAAILLGAADAAQAKVRQDGRVSRMEGSHARARSAVRVALDIHPVPFGAEPADMARWADTLAVAAASLISVALSILELDFAGDRLTG